MNRKSKVHIVPHSHWDREWYFTIEDSNIMLVENLDALINVLEKTPSFPAYVFDAQVSVIEDYLAIRPENRERLKELIKQRRILIGPWYTQTDSLLVNRESVIRNLLYGVREANLLGHSMEVGYLPDIFGQNAYLPSFFQEFGIHYSVLQRGLYNDQIARDLNFTWVSPDGQEVKTNNIYYGYGPGKFLEPSSTYFTERLNPILEALEQRNASTERILLPAGGDQVLVREHFPETVEWLNRHDPNREYVLSDYTTFMEETWSAADFEGQIEGELIASQKSRIHSTIRSQRIDLKQLNYRVENKLLYILEPLACIASALGFKYPKTWIDRVWKLLFDVHAHDSIGGCNSDDTNQSIMMRLIQSERMIDGLANVLKKQLARAVQEREAAGDCLVFSFLPERKKMLCPFVVFTKDSRLTLHDRAGAPLESMIVKQEYISGGRQVMVTAEGEREVEIPGYYRTELLARAEVPAMGYTTLRVREGEPTEEWAPASEAKISNEMYRLEWSDGELALEDHRNGKRVSSLLRFEDVGDAGDSYDFSPLEGDSPIFGSQCELVEVKQGPLSSLLAVRHTMKVPGSLEERALGKAETTLVIETAFELRAGESFVRVTHSLNNSACDHRLRVLFNHKGEHTWADQAFTALRREKTNPHLQNWREKGFAEAPVPVYPLENYVVADGRDGLLGVITEGLKEYELLEDELALTLFRAVGLLGKDDLAWRPGRASGINNKVVETPDAQLLKPLTFSYGLHVTEEPFCAKAWSGLVEAYIGYRTTYHLQTLNTFEERLERFELPQPVSCVPSEFSLLSLQGHVFVSAMKQSEDGDGVILRLYNPGDQDEPISPHSDIYAGTQRVTLAELPASGSVTSVPAKGYMTLKWLTDKERTI
ncbi:glycoside hydrolase family 38 C-terminal domain-containing protein [Paenibacillus sp. NPDC058910]|uniref:glycoside hydrolase family 38 N-terminal domain-containing protein n=1 Tax=unclassified Paenibacillus TaxID=185978 RepID=UPI00367F42BB